MSEENEIEAEKLSQTTDFLPSDGASCSRRCVPQLSGSETTAFREVIVDADQDVIWTRDGNNNVIGYTITNPKPLAGMSHILNDGRLSALDVPIHRENASAMAPPPQRLPSTKDVPGG